MLEFNCVESGFNSVESGFNSVESGFNSVKSGFNSVKSGFNLFFFIGLELYENCLEPDEICLTVSDTIFCIHIHL